MIRPACLSDKSRVIEMLRDFHAEWLARAGASLLTAGDPALEFYPDYAERLFAAHLRSTRACALVLDIEGAAHGLLLAVAIDHLLGPVRIAKENAWWIDPAQRGPSAMRLIAAYLAWARAQGCRVAEMSGLGADPAVAVIYQRCGFVRMETSYVKAL
ncbi:GNAT family N-acetyltransferase [Bradyrhizobium quebecense]|uniref:N-acetyltransferase domain-containing protein n=1 Tax=Bradyrhizobium quebecense TaxID=2748629 RepID=A0A974AEG9_9BRAD|nr:GNAT family N-acetyltransferase [Bradyrhizobium quebecense]UGA45950.1 GNAT family N-acetyltransferase [Bradyrhizobium quebecense]